MMRKAAFLGGLLLLAGCGTTPLDPYRCDWRSLANDPSLLIPCGGPPRCFDLKTGKEVSRDHCVKGLEPASAPPDNGDALPPMH